MPRNVSRAVAASTSRTFTQRQYVAGLLFPTTPWQMGPASHAPHTFTALPRTLGQRGKLTGPAAGPLTNLPNRQQLHSGHLLQRFAAAARPQACSSRSRAAAAAQLSRQRISARRASSMGSGFVSMAPSFAPASLSTPTNSRTVVHQLGFPSDVTAQEIARETSLGGSIDLCEKQNRLLREENAALRRVLQGGNAA